MESEIAHHRLVEERVMARRLEAVAATAPYFSLALLASVLILVLVMEGSAPRPLLLAWAGAILFLLAFNLGPPARFLLRNFFPVPDRNDRSGRARSRYALHSLLLQAGSLVWAIGMPVFTWYARDEQYAALGVVGTAVFTGVLLMHRYMPRAAFFHVAAMALGAMASLLVADGWGVWPIMVLTLIYAVVLVRAILVNDQGFVEGIAARVSREEADNMIRLLLKEYEVQAQDWLWTIGPNGNLREVSPRFAEICGQDAASLEGTPLLDLFLPGARRERLASLIEDRRAFADELLIREDQGERRYWRLSARPRMDGRMTGVARDVTDNRVIEERVQYMAHFDDLTGLANRYSFNERLTRELQRRERKDHTLAPLTLFYCDLDDFKGVNDTLGHQAGDLLLREVATRLEGQLRAEDMVARLGGDEFVVLLAIASGDGMVIERAHRMLSALREPYRIDGHSVVVSASIGIARSGREPLAPDELVRRADLALQEAKRKGRDQIALFAPQLDAAMRERRQVEQDLRSAIAGGDLELHYQPIIDLENGATVAYEALARWNHPVRGLLSPDQFLTVAEETGLIVPLGDWVLATALRELSLWDGDFRIAINLSPSQIRAPGLLPGLAAALAKSAIDPGRLEFEVTEHILLNDTETSLAALQRLREMGASIALDDFGTGYSSLAYLRRFPFDRIKIDRSFVTDLETSESSRAIVCAITQLAEALAMKTTAEGVESAGQLDLLRELGCDEAQGYLIRTPQPAARLTTARRRGETEVLDYRKARVSSMKRSGQAG